jgi:RNA polymerase sigma factor (sigma-70 family)
VEDPRGWAYRVIYRIAMDQHRFGRRLQGLRQRIASQWRHPSQQDLADRIAVWTEIDRLPPRQRQVLYLRYRSDLPFDDIADVVGITASAARSHATQAMATLRRRLLDEDGR